MGMEYNKEGAGSVRKDRVHISGSGPRDVQRRQKADYDHGLVQTLNKQIQVLTEQLSHAQTTPVAAAPNAKYTAEEFDAELAKAIIKTTEDIEKKYKSEIKELKTAAKPSMSDDEINQAIIDAVEDAVNDTYQKEQAKYHKLKSEYIALEEKLKAAQEIISVKDEMIATLKSRPMVESDSGMGEIPSDRPQMEEVFIDPAEQKEMESFIKVKDVTDKKEDTADKVNKLKSLIGGLK